MMSWNSSTDCCNWGGVTCDDSTGDVIGLDVSCGMLKGTIHPNTSLFNLPHLQKLNLAFNYFYPSKIPREIGRFSNSITHLNLSGCGFSGQVPPDITLLRKLVSVDLSLNDNDLKLGPHVFINMFRNFTHLEELSLGGVNISSVLPTSLNISSSLELLNLYHTGMRGILPHYIFNLHSLETLVLEGNSFTGDIPSKISITTTHLTSLVLSGNKLNGTLPSWLFTSHSLEYLYLNDNMFSGNVPFESFVLPSLKELDFDLSFNSFSGELELDTLLSSITKLEVLDLSYSGFSVTTNNANHYVNPSFRYLRLASCNLNMFPNSFQAMRKLEYLDLSSNEIHGQIPHWAREIGGTDGLKYLNLSHNLITGLPQFQWYGLSQLHLQSNLIQEPFPPSICNMSNLFYLDLSSNRFAGLIPQCFGKLTSYLVMIDMGNNSFQATIPSLYDDCEELEGLILKGNQLEGQVPSSLSKCQSLKVVDFGNNHLNGTFPGWLGDLPNLQALVLKSNNFHGLIQPSSTDEFPFPSLRVLDLSLNGFVGQLPAKYFQNFNSMKNVIPKVIGGLNSLIVLNLSHNSLIGPIPHALGNLIEIESLDLSWNQLSGEIPQRLYGFPLPKREHQSSPQVEDNDDEEEENGFTWKMVMLGYGCGTIIGLLMGYLMLSSTRPNWLSAIADAGEQMILKRRDKRRRVYMRK
ncbi:leucine-rich repeat-containing protein [Tanacetum coccineum]